MRPQGETSAVQCPLEAAGAELRIERNYSVLIRQRDIATAMAAHPRIFNVGTEAGS